jgi:uncharacterized protein (DUF488 family)
MNKQKVIQTDKLPQFYRQRFLVALVQMFRNKLSKTDLQKYLFLYNQVYRETNKVYYFVPYKYGPFSFQAYADLRRLDELGILEDGESIKSLSTDDYISFLEKSDQVNLREFFMIYQGLTGDNLIRRIYDQYPYYASKSEIRNRIGSSLIKDSSAVSKLDEAIYSLGYEGTTVDEYLNTLVQKDIKTVIDVRKNPVSMKYGFSKKTLENALTQLDINYLHLPELGIESKDRKDLSSLESYNELFDTYEKEVLSHSDGYIQKIVDEFKDQKRVVLTCFEKDYHYCHRSRIGNLIENQYGISIKHL